MTAVGTIPGAPARGAGIRWPSYVAPIPALALLVLGVGIALRAAGRADAAEAIWFGGLVVSGAPLVWRTVRGMARGHFASDVVATLAIVAAVALAEPVAGLVVVLMQSGGEALERYAEGRASAAVRALEEDAPRIAHRLTAVAEDGDEISVAEIRVGDIRVGDTLLVRPGEMVPCDATVVEGTSHVDASRLTGEPLPVSAAAETRLLSGSLNVDGPLVVRADAIAAESQYAQIVRLVRSAQASKAPLQRIADRYAVWFTPVTLLVCAIAYLASGEAQRVLAVLVVATPCPLILATPVAIIGGINRAARAHVVVRNGVALEQLAAANVAVFDKTGTLTVGSPEVAQVGTRDGRDAGEVLRLAAGVEQGSGHLLARSVVHAALSAGLALPRPTEVTEFPGSGVRGIVEGHDVIVGSLALLADRAPGALRAFADHGASPGLRSFVVIDGSAAGTLEYADQVRPGLRELFARLHGAGIERVILLSGDSAAHTRAVAAEVGIDDARGELLPADKVSVVRGLVESGARVMMVGDGTNDAPALSTASVGVALAGHGGGIAAEAAQVVVLGSDPTRIAEVIAIARHALRVARQSIGVGLGLSGIAMIVAAAGGIQPIAGALLQEAIDVAVILNALRAAGAPPRTHA